jgi:hypothetical protein
VGFTYLKSLQQVEEPLLEVIFKGVDQKVSVGDVGVAKHGLIGKVPVYELLYLLQPVPAYLNLLPSFPPPVVHQSASALMTATL